MASLFQGAPQTATSYTTSSTETPKWMQDAIYNQIQLAQQVAATPYQGYSMPTVAELSPLQQQAYQQVQSNQGVWKPAMAQSMTGLSALASAPGGAAAAQPGFNAQSQMLSGIDYNKPANTLQPFVQQALNTNGAAAAQPYIGQASQMATAAGSTSTAGQLGQDQSAYLHPELAQQNLTAGQNAWDRAGNLDVIGAAQPYIQGSGAAAQGALGQHASAAAQPYLSGASGTAAQGVANYSSPYQQQVMDVIAKQGARNLSENLLPAVSDQFIRAGQFGGTRMGEFGSRALRDTQESVLGQQAQLAQQGYQQAVQASQSDLARQAQLAGTAGQLAGTDINNTLQGAQQLGALGQMQGALTGQQQQNMTSLGGAQTSAGQQQQQIGLSASQQYQQAQQADLARQLAASGQIGQFGQTMGNLTQAQQQAILAGGQALSGAQQQSIGQALSGASQFGQQGAQMGALTGTDQAHQLGALGQLASTGQQAQGMGAADVAGLEAAGTAQQQQMQQQLNAAYQQHLAEQNYPRSQLDWLNTQIRGMAPSVPQSTTQAGSQTGGSYSASPLSQLATGLYTYKGFTS